MVTRSRILKRSISSSISSHCSCWRIKGTQRKHALFNVIWSPLYLSCLHSKKFNSVVLVSSDYADSDASVSALGNIPTSCLSPENRFIFTDPSQLVETARFPAAYPAHYVAEYVIQRPPRHAESAIMLSFTDYFVSPWSLLEVCCPRTGLGLL